MAPGAGASRVVWAGRCGGGSSRRSAQTTISMSAERRDEEAEEAVDDRVRQVRAILGVADHGRAAGGEARERAWG